MSPCTKSSTILTLLLTLTTTTLVSSSTLKLTETELLQYDGTDASKPIYLAIAGNIYDVSASPAFYGPGGHYHHFTGRDATRAWVTECWDEGPAQFTWRLDGGDLGSMFHARYVDEILETVVDGTYDEDGEDAAALVGLPQKKEELKMIAGLVVEKFGRVTEAEKEKRKALEEKEAQKQIQAVVDKWVKFFEGNAKYKQVGEVVKEEREVPPAPCKAAYKKRPTKYGKLTDFMKTLEKLQAKKDAQHEEL